MLNLKKSNSTILVVLSICFSLILACEKDDINPKEEFPSQKGYCKVLELYDSTGDNYIELQISGDNEIHVEDFLDLTEFTLETYVKDNFVARLTESEDLILDNYEHDEEIENEELIREVGFIRILTIKSHLVSDDIGYRWIAHKQPGHLKSTATKRDMILFTNDDKPDEFSGTISFVHLPGISDDFLACHWYRRWSKNTLFGRDNEWTHTKNEVLEYMVKPYSTLGYNGKQIKCYIFHRYSNYTYSSWNAELPVYVQTSEK